MSTFLYYGGTVNGQTGVLLSRLQILSYQRQPIWHGPDRAYVKHVLHVRGIYNPEVNAYDFVQTPPASAQPSAILTGMRTSDAFGKTRDIDPASRITLAASLAGTGGRLGATPGTARGAMAPVTDLAVRDFLMQPRRQLVLMVGRTPLLVSPGVDADGLVYSRDALNGPTPLSCDVVRVSGGKTFVVEFAIETYLNDSLIYTAAPSALLTHRYERTHDIDQDYYTVITTSGTALFRTDRLAAIGAVADDFRAYLFHPVPMGFKRVAVNVKAAEDGSALSYTTVDKELALSIVPSGVTRIECFHTVASAGWKHEEFSPDVFKGVLSVFSVAEPGPRLAELVGMYQKAIPRVTVKAVARVWGRPDTLRYGLQIVATNLVLIRMAMSVGRVALSSSGMSLSVTHDVAGSFVEVVGEATTALTETTLKIVTDVAAGGGAPTLWAGGVTNVPDLHICFPADTDDTPGVLQLNVDGDGMDLPNMPNTMGTHSRGTYVGRLAAASLLAPHATPPTPSTSGSGRTTTPP